MHHAVGASAVSPPSLFPQRGGNVGTEAAALRCFRPSERWLLPRRLLPTPWCTVIVPSTASSLVIAGSSAVAAGSTSTSASGRRMCRRKEDTCPALGKAVAAGIGTVPTPISPSAAEAASAVAPSVVVPTVTSGEEEAAAAVTPSAVSRATPGEEEAARAPSLAPSGT